MIMSSVSLRRIVNHYFFSLPSLAFFLKKEKEVNFWQLLFCCDLLCIHAQYIRYMIMQKFCFGDPRPVQTGYGGPAGNEDLHTDNTDCILLYENNEQWLLRKPFNTDSDHTHTRNSAMPLKKSHRAWPPQSNYANCFNALALFMHGV